jgi:hypothetical protein
MIQRKQKVQKIDTSLIKRPSQSPDYEAAYRDARESIKNLDRKILKSINKGIQYDWLNNTSFNNVIYPKDKIPDRLLRLIERRNGIVGSVITLRIQQAIEYSQISNDPDVPGWNFILKDPKGTIEGPKIKQREFLQNFMMNTHRDDYESLEPKTDTFRDLLTKYVRDRYLIDKVVWEVERDRKGMAAALWVLDGATIIPVLPGGFYGSTSLIGVGMGPGINKVSEAIRQARLENVPPMEEIAYVQELLYGSSGGGITAAFRESDLIYDIANPLNDVRYYKQGFSVVEKANMAIVAFMNSLSFNSNGLARGAIPKIAIAMGKDSGYTQDQLEDAEDEWAANFMSMDGQWNIPLLNGDAKVLNLLPNNRDMEYQKYMEFTGALTCAIMGVDSAEIGLRLNQAQNVLSENQDAKQLFSKNRGTREMLNGFSYIVNRFLKSSGFPFADEWIFKFNGLSIGDKSFEADLRKKDVESIKTIDEVRAEMDLPPLPNGEGQIILNSVYAQIKQASMMSQDQGDMGGGDEGGFGGFSDEDADSMADEAMAGLEKSVRLI